MRLSLPPALAHHWRVRNPFQGRFQAHGRLLLLFLGMNALVRLGLTVFNQDLTLLAPWRLLPAMLIGAGFDLCVGLAALVPLVCLMAIWPRQRLRGDRGLRLACGVLLAPLCLLATFVALSEFTFWQEFASRFNFIAVEYLIYTKEVIGNIRESYNMPVLLGGVALTAAGLWLLAWRWALAPLAHARPATPARRHWRPGLLLGLAAPALLLASCDARLKEFSGDSQLNELAGNGYFDFWHAFRHNQLDYERFYRTLPVAEAERRVAARYQDQAATAKRAQEAAPTSPAQTGAGGDRLPFSRVVAGAASPLPLNVVMVSIESFSASFMGTFGNAQGLTPNLDRIAREGLLFTRVYATGTRTVRGLEALTLSVPPTPGHSIVKRPDNAGLVSLGGVLAEQGYEPIYLYGGYGYFDNMNAFFGGNGYTVVDRTALRPEQIHFENIWGVADEDLFDLTLRELDARHTAGRRFFAHVMTTSNHRPFTYPEGRIDIPSHSGREGGVKYTDYAIGRFIAQARTRPWFGNTLFVLVADHTHQGRGKQDLPLEAYHIPLIFLAPGHIAPGRIETLASQIDVGPTLLGMLGVGYRSRFFGQDILREGRDKPRAFMANQQTLGYYRDERMVELRPNRRQRVIDARTGEPVDDAAATEMTAEAISLYQVAARAYRQGDLRASPRPAR
jgi:phosphoglycerol transferase MdoB-like AlkP superfamily enzyme